MEKCHSHDKVIIATPPGEGHLLGLLALKAALTLAGYKCINLGAQIPTDSLVRAVQDFGATVVGISISSNFSPHVASSYVLALRGQLPTQCRLWIGGAGAMHLSPKALDSAEIFNRTDEAVSALAKVGFIKLN